MTDLIRRVHQIPGSLHRPDDRVVALTFDDGPGPSTPAVLDTLAETRTPATFFMVGMQIESRPGDAVRVAAAGHTIGTHTWSHRRPDELGDDGIRAETARSNALVRELTGYEVRYVRPPYLPEYASQFDAVLAPLGIVTVVWSLDPRDWERSDPDEITGAVLDGLHPGAIVVMHDGGGRERPATVAALATIVAGAEDRGYRFVAL